MPESTRIANLGANRFVSPFHLGNLPGDNLADFARDEARLMAELDPARLEEIRRAGGEPPTLELAGPRERLFFQPPALKAGVVTCGGLCPGLNHVVRSLVLTLWHGYGVREIAGFRFGYAGLNPAPGLEPLALTPDGVREIHREGGTVLGTSRGPEDPAVMMDTLERIGIGVLFAVGGDGTFRGLQALAGEAGRRGAPISLVGIPKTIDNDIPLLDRTFGFDTAVGLASQAIQAAHFEAASARRGVGLVKLMGREAGFIAASAALACGNADLVLVPELPFEMAGAHGLLAFLEERISNNRSTVIVVAEGAGQDLVAGGGADASGNRRLGDIGLFLKRAIEEAFGSQGVSVKYIEPSYLIRSSTPCPRDAIFCNHLAQAAVHAGLAGKTGLAVGSVHGRLVHLPLELLVGGRKCLDPEGELWLSVLQATGQPFFLTASPPKHLACRRFAWR